MEYQKTRKKLEAIRLVIRYLNQQTTAIALSCWREELAGLDLASVADVAAEQARAYLFDIKLDREDSVIKELREDASTYLYG